MKTLENNGKNMEQPKKIQTPWVFRVCHLILASLGLSVDTIHSNELQEFGVARMSSSVTASFGVEDLFEWMTFPRVSAVARKCNG